MFKSTRGLNGTLSDILSVYNMTNIKCDNFCKDFWVREFQDFMTYIVHVSHAFLSCIPSRKDTQKKLCVSKSTNRSSINELKVNNKSVT